VIQVVGSVQNDAVTVAVDNVTTSLLAVSLDLGSGNDVVTFSIDEVNAGVVDADFLLGKGLNLLTLTQSGDITNGSLVDLDVEGGLQTDKVSATFAGDVNASTLLFDASLGGGNDFANLIFDLSGFDVLPGGEAHFTVDGGDGLDQLTAAKGTAAGPASLDGLLSLSLNGGAGKDILSVDLGGTGAIESSSGTGELRVRADGGDADDSILVSLVSAQASSGLNYDVVLSGGRGNDSLQLTQAVFPGSEIPANFAPAGFAIVDGGPGEDACTVNGNGLFKKRSCEL
jgi:hypothetical protein